MLSGEVPGNGAAEHSKMRELPDGATRTDAMVTHAFALARSLGVQSVLVQADEMNDIRLIERVRKSESLIWVMRQSNLPEGADPKTDIVISIPDGGLNRISRVHLALLLAVLNGMLDRAETILCLSGIVGSGHLDTVFLTKPSEDLPWLKAIDSAYKVGRHLGRLLTIAVRLASEGREGKPMALSLSRETPAASPPICVSLFSILVPGILRKHSTSITLRCLKHCESSPRWTVPSLSMRTESSNRREHIWTPPSEIGHCDQVSERVTLPRLQ